MTNVDPLSVGQLVPKYATRTPKATVVFSLPLELACSPSVRCEIAPLILKEFVHGIRASAIFV